jgi:hypothetical protein
MTACAAGYDRVLPGIGMRAGWDQVVDDIKQFDEHTVSRRMEDPWRNVET